MYKTILRASFALLIIFSACDGQEQQTPSDMGLETLPWITSKTLLRVSIWSTEGEKISRSSQLKADMQYRIKVESDVPISMKLKVADGFTTESCDKDIYVLDTERSYLIRTDAGISGKLYMSFVPLHKSDNGFVRERPQAFLLPDVDPH